MQRLTMHAIALVVLYRGKRRIDRDFVEIGAAESRDLRIRIGMDSTGEQRIITEIDTRYDVRRAECDLLGFREEVVRVAVSGINETKSQNVSCADAAWGMP